LNTFIEDKVGPYLNYNINESMNSIKSYCGNTQSAGLSLVIKQTSKIYWSNSRYEDFIYFPNIVALKEKKITQAVWRIRHRII